MKPDTELLTDYIKLLCPECDINDIDKNIVRNSFGFAYYRLGCAIKEVKRQISAAIRASFWGRLWRTKEKK